MLIVIESHDWKFQFFDGKNFKDFIFCLIFAIFQSGLYWRHCKIFKKSSKMVKIWQKMKKIDFSFFALNFSRKNEKIAKNKNFRFSLKTIIANHNMQVHNTCTCCIVLINVSSQLKILFNQTKNYSQIFFMQNFIFRQRNWI